MSFERKGEILGEAHELLRSIFLVQLGISFFSKVNEVFIWIFEHDVYIYTKCAFYHFCFYFSKHQNILMGLPMCSSRGRL